MVAHTPGTGYWLGGAAEEAVFASDFYIIQVEGDDWKKASRFLIQESLWTKLGQPFWVEREQLVRTLEEGYVVEVLLKGMENKPDRRLLLVSLADEPRFRKQGVPGRHSPGASPAGSTSLSVSSM